MWVVVDDNDDDDEDAARAGASLGSTGRSDFGTRTPDILVPF
jgi:hypothetical protein